MFLRGINYDVGTFFRGGKCSRPDFDEAVIRKEIAIIRNELHCDAVRISGFDVHRLSRAAEFALEQGLEVWLSPAYIEATKDEALAYLVECAIEAEKLRKKYPNLIFVVGCEYSLFLKGFVKGDTIYVRLKKMFTPWSILMNSIGLRQKLHRNLNAFLKDATEKIKSQFGGKLSYASGTWEKIDWNLFDIVGIDHYRASYNKAVYIKQLAEYYKFNKPVAVLEFGCCAYKGADEKGGTGWAITTQTKDGKHIINGNYVRDETMQANYIVELLELFSREKIHGAFVFTFINPRYKYNSDPQFDLDLASYGIVKPVENLSDGAYEGLAWVPKEAFYRLRDFYGKTK